MRSRLVQRLNCLEVGRTLEQEPREVVASPSWYLKLAWEEP